MRRIAIAVLTSVGFLSVGCGSAPVTPTTPTAPTVFRQGTLAIPQTWTADLDTGTFPSASDPSDIWFHCVTDADRYLAPTGARLAVSGTTPPGYAGCSGATLTAAEIPVTTLTAGLYLCARTDEGRVVQLRVVEPPGPGSVSATLTIGFTTYNK